jgi:arginase
MAPDIVVVGSPTALGGHFGGMERTPAELRRLGLLDALRDRPGLAAAAIDDHGDARNEPGWAPDPDPHAMNRAAIVAYLPRLAAHTAAALERARSGSRLLVLGGDCTTHAGALAGLRRARPGRRLGLVWFDAHGDFNTPTSTPSGNVWGMPFAMICGLGEDDLLAACDAPTIEMADAALCGGQVLDEAESRRLAASPIAHFGAGMLATVAGQAALDGWARAVAARVDGWYIAVDLDAIDASEGLAVAMPEVDGLSLATTLDAIRRIAASGPVVGLGVTAAMFGETGDPDRTVAGIADIVEVALG